MVQHHGVCRADHEEGSCVTSEFNLSPCMALYGATDAYDFTKFN